MKEIYYELTINEFKDIEDIYIKEEFWKIDKIQKNSKNELHCYRCGNKNLTLFKEQIYCKNCIEFNKIKYGEFFYQKKGTKRQFKYKDRLDELIFSKKQLIASKFIFSCIYMETDCLIHAVCGAGKTEITFQAISYFLKKNKFICFAIPRIDILYEIYERLSYYFYDTDICILNSKEKKIQPGQIYIMTTNQIIKFKKVFSLIIVDEIDAFPYEFNLKYDYGVQNAKEDQGTIVYLTSTPSQNFLKKKLPMYVINRRWHGKDLPIPIFKFFHLNNFLKHGNKEFLKNLYEYNKDKQLLIFISNIKVGYKVKNKLELAGLNIRFVYANSKDRLDDIKDFKKKEVNILLTTTILERGITFENIDAIILDSHSKLYNKAALIQIAGRVNRKKEYQDGTIYFYYEDITKNMKEAKKDIEKFNL